MMMPTMMPHNPTSTPRIKNGSFGYAECKNPQLKAASATARGHDRVSFFRNGMAKARNCISSETAGKKPPKRTATQGMCVFSTFEKGISEGAHAPKRLAA